MFAPIRALLTPRRHAPLAVLAGAAVVSFMFSATPFLIPEVADRYGVALGSAGFISTFQVSGFGLVAFLAGRWWRPTRTKLVMALLAMVVFDAGSALTSDLPMLLGLRFAAGGAAGVLTWLAWADAMRHPGSMRDVAAIGPITALVSAPLLVWMAESGGDRALYWVLAVSPLLAVFVPISFGDAVRSARDPMSPSRSNRVLLFALAIMTMAGAALFVFVGALAQDEIGMSGLGLSLGFSLHSLSGLVAARTPGRRRRSWPWIGLTALSAAALVVLPNPVVFYVAMTTWGYGFWMAVPGVLDAVAAWSFVREERVGDAQSLMAVGRAIGPAVGGVLVGNDAFLILGLCAGAGLGVSTAMVAGVETYRTDRSAPRPT
ncbi:MAG TPA: hypothetical protein DCY40_02930 [Actinobacteria bacterium]|nr:hypothetical protein [Actinomycetota bacterium]